MSDLDKLLVRCWSTVVARGEDGSVAAIIAELRARGLEYPDVATRLADLRRRGCISDE